MGQRAHRKCLRGHDLSVVGRAKCGGCALCIRRKNDLAYAVRTAAKWNARVQALRHELDRPGHHVVIRLGGERPDPDGFQQQDEMWADGQR